MSRRILLADDSVTIQKVIELTFMDEDFEVKAVSNGDDAIAFLGANPADLVIADIHMPGANGYEVCRRAKELHPRVPVLLLVGTFEPFDENQARACGASSYLKKPFDSQELLQRVHEMLAAGGEAAAAPAAQAAAPVPGGAAPAAPVGTAPAAPTPAPASTGAAAAVPGDWLEPSTGLEPAAAPEWHGFELEAEPEAVSPEPPTAPSPAHEPATAPLSHPGLAAPGAHGEPAEARQFTLADEPPSRPAPLPPTDQPFTLGEPLDERDFRLEPPEPLAAHPLPSFEIEPEPPQPFRLEEEEEPAPSSGSAGWAAAYSRAASPAAEAEPVSAQSERSDPFARSAAPERPARPAGFPTWSPAVEERAGVPTSHPLEAAGAAAPAALAPAPPAPAAPLAAPTSEANGGGARALSVEDVDRIARRVVELIGDKVVRDVAWEVIPDLAEVVIKDRLRELEGQVE